MVYVKSAIRSLLYFIDTLLRLYRTPFVSTPFHDKSPLYRIIFVHMWVIRCLTSCQLIDFRSGLRFLVAFFLSVSLVLCFEYRYR